MALWAKSPIPLFLHPTFLFHLLAFSMPITFINHPHSMIFPCYFHGMFLTKLSIPWRNGCKMHVVWQLIDILTWFFHTKKQWRKCGKNASADSSGNVWPWAGQDEALIRLRKIFPQGHKQKCRKTKVPHFYLEWPNWSEWPARSVQPVLYEWPA